ncbi:MAG: ECF transporter S component [Bacilli bacterium]|jgi:ECF transporter S component (folate family)
MKLDSVQKITLSGIFIALVIILTRFLAIQYIPLIPFVRISLGPALIIFSSLLLGPIYGGVIGGLSDFLGILLVPNPQGFMINPFITLNYVLLGVLPWVTLFVIKKIKMQKSAPYIFFGAIGAIWLFIVFFLVFNDSITLYGAIYRFDALSKSLIISLSFVLSVLMSVAIFYTNRFFIKKNISGTLLATPYQVAFVCLVSEILLMLIVGSIVKAFFFGVDFMFIFFSQAVVLFINIPLNTFVTSYLLVLSSRLYIKYEGN